MDSRERGRNKPKIICLINDEAYLEQSDEEYKSIMENLRVIAAALRDDTDYSLSVLARVSNADMASEGVTSS